MKEQVMYFSRVIAVCLSLILVFASVSCDDDYDNDKKSERTYTISGAANGTQMVPSVAGTGTGTITGTFNSKTRELNYTSNWSGLSGAPTSGGFYTGAAGSSGVALGTPWTFDATATGTGSRTGTVVLTSDQADQLLDGNWYYSYGTAMNPNGEVRGQITTTASSTSN